VLTAISLSSVLDILIIVIWARHENKKRERDGKGSSSRFKWTEKKWFWSIIAFGITQPNNGRLSINWKNLIIFMVLMSIFKYCLSKRIGETQGQLLNYLAAGA
jgi:hypothetical protein